METEKHVDDFDQIDRTLAGENLAFDLLVKKYHQRMFLVAFRITQNRDEAEDVTQQAFLKAFVNLHKFKKKSSFSTWLYRITCNIAINSFQQRKKMTTGVDEKMIQSNNNGLQALEIQEDVAQVRQAIKKLPKKQRITLILRVYEKLPFKEIAKILKCSEGGAKANYFQAISKMKKNLASYMKLGGSNNEMS